jgi:hypothetical protein
MDNGANYLKRVLGVPYIYLHVCDVVLWAISHVW